MFSKSKQCGQANKFALFFLRFIAHRASAYIHIEQWVVTQRLYVQHFRSQSSLKLYHNIIVMALWHCSKYSKALFYDQWIEFVIWNNDDDWWLSRCRSKMHRYKLKWIQFRNESQSINVELVVWLVVFWWPRWNR